MKNATIVDSNGKRDNVHVLVEGKKIIKVSREELNISAIEYDLRGYTLMPGFINTHVHLMDCFDGFNDDKLKKWLMAGITYLRDEGILSRHTVKAATLGGAEILGKKDYGKIEENYIADLIAVKGNPYELPYLSSCVNFLMKDGIVIKNV